MERGSGGQENSDQLSSEKKEAVSRIEQWVEKVRKGKKETEERKRERSDRGKTGEEGVRRGRPTNVERLGRERSSSTESASSVTSWVKKRNRELDREDLEATQSIKQRRVVGEIKRNKDKEEEDKMEELKKMIMEMRNEIMGKLEENKQELKGEIKIMK